MDSYLDEDHENSFSDSESNTSNTSNFSDQKSRDSLVRGKHTTLNEIEPPTLYIFENNSGQDENKDISSEDSPKSNVDKDLHANYKNISPPSEINISASNTSNTTVFDTLKRKASDLIPERLPLPKKRSDNRSQDDSVLGFGCPICLSDIRNKTYIFNCYHPFCFKCLFKYVQSTYPDCTCPLCKQPFKKIIYSFHQGNIETTLDFDKIENLESSDFKQDISLRIENDPSTNFKVISCYDLSKNPTLKVVTSLRDLSKQFNVILKKSFRDRQLVYEYALSPIFSSTVMRRLDKEINQVPFTGLNQYNFSLENSFLDKTTDGMMQFLKRDILAILNIIRPLDIEDESILNLFITSILSILNNNDMFSKTLIYQNLVGLLDDYLFPYGKKFLNELLGFLYTPFFPSVQQYDKWINYKEPA